MPVKPPRPPSPPLNALRAFEAAARLGGFTRAADELCVTPGAVAQQVKQLEAWAGEPLFERRAHGVVLTPVGKTVGPLLETAFDALGDAVSALRQAATPQRIHIAASPAVAQLWLSPRLPELRQAYPALELSLTAMEHPPNLEREQFDIALFMVPEGAPHQIATDVVRPACSPQLAENLRKPHDLLNVPCLADSVWVGDWDLWLAQNAADLTGRLRGPSYSLYALAVQEAVNGGGVLMGHECLIAPLVEAGRLVYPFPSLVATGLALSLSTRQPAVGPLAQLMDHLSSESGF
ncbi:LysR family transcriptional regulator [uncultured Shimia sp.]|uniref:LysR family transcriptional regulator n=1 Tax=uncultured Shimia sp. TaxID=573152 RepID=UPI002619F2C1|nr:LysR family transcriptional regulator [uncultured Shimia sp.]